MNRIKFFKVPITLTRTYGSIFVFVIFKVLVVITSRKRICGKVMFFHLRVILFMGGEVSVRDGSLSRGSLSRGVSVQGVSVRGVFDHRVSVRGSLSRGISVRETPVRYRAGGTYPTGMHSCLKMHRDYLPHLFK